MLAEAGKEGGRVNIPITTPKYVKDKNGSIRRFDKLPPNLKMQVIQQLEEREIRRMRADENRKDSIKFVAEERRAGE